MRLAIAVVSWIIVAWICYIFLGSLPYKFTNHPDTQHIFMTIGDWLGGFFGDGIGSLFSQYAAYLIGSFELLTALILLLPLLKWRKRTGLHQLGGLMASAVMVGAVFFHLVSPLGIEVLHQGQSDGGSLFYSAVSILLLGIVLFTINRYAAKAD